MMNSHLFVRGLLAGICLAFVTVSAGGQNAWAETTFVKDREFGVDGLVSGPVGSIEQSATLSPKALAVDSRGRVIVGAATWTEWKVWRILPNGKLDATFGDEGEFTVSYWGGSHSQELANLASGVIRPDGRILLLGYTGGSLQGNIRKHNATLVMFQLMPDGSPDPGFGRSGGKSFGSGRGGVKLALRPDGGIYVGAFQQYSHTGRTDDGALFSFTDSGKLIRGFGPGKNVDAVNILGAPGRPSYIFDIDLLPDGRILVCGVVRNRLLLMRLNPDGSRDRSFAKGGQASWLPSGNSAIWAAARDMEVDGNGRIVLAGSVDPSDPSDAAYGLIMRFRKDGSLDRSFGKGGAVEVYATPRKGFDRRTSLYDVTIDSMGGIWVTGSAGKADRDERRAISARYLPTGKKDRTSFKQGILNFRLGEGSFGSASLRSGRKIYVSGRYDRGGSEQFFLGRFKPRG